MDGTYGGPVTQASGRLDQERRDTRNAPPPTRHTIAAALNNQIETLGRLRNVQAEFRDRLAVVLGPPMPSAECASNKVSKVPESILEQIDSATAVIELAVHDVYDLMRRLEL